MGISNQLPMIIAESLVPNQTVVAAPFPLREETRCLTLARVSPTDRPRRSRAAAGSERVEATRLAGAGSFGSEAEQCDAALR